MKFYKNTVCQIRVEEKLNQNLLKLKFNINQLFKKSH